ncbi:MAG TPA: carboxypeptidase regulatory-like domain-containing protein [Terriglobia bacterium]|nr:carboxypeptidase regulatory-like domain-containing protein [Terriglobia bacterium]
MPKKRFFMGMSAWLAAAGVCACIVSAQTSSSPALTGVVRSQEEGPMEGVLVSAKRAGSNVTITVVSDAQGRYSFPPDRLEPGQYSVRIRAVGYVPDKPAQIEVSAQKTSQVDLKLVKSEDLSRQLSNGEWLMSMTGTKEQKEIFLGCVGCHTLERVVRSQHDAPEFVQVFRRMTSYAQGSTPIRPQMRLSAGGAGGGDMDASPRSQSQLLKQAEYAATINLSASSKWPYELKTVPRPRGKATRVIITEYDLPRPEALPHDAMADSQGMVWYSDFGSQYLGKLDPKTGKVVEYPVPLMEAKEPKGALDLEPDRDGNLWLGTMYQGVIARFDPKTEKFQTWKSPKFAQGDAARTAMVTPGNIHIDGKVWVGADDEYQVDLKTGEWKAIDYHRDIPKDSSLANRNFGSYGVASDSKNNFYGLNLNGEFITKVDATTMKATPFATPTPNSGPRRGHMDAQDRLWFAEFRGNKIGMFDTRSERFQEWTVPTEWTNPYDAILDKDGNAWTGGMSNDHIVRVNTKTNEVTEYLLPRMTNVRRVNVDNSTNPPTFWVGNNLGATIIKLEPLQ